MRSLPLLVAGAVGVSTLALVGTDLRSTSRRATVNVDVDVRCPANGSVTVTVDPWRAVLNRGDDIQWTLRGNASSDSLEITSKTGRWPFTQQPPRRGTKANAARAADMAPGASGRYRYNIKLWCVQGNDTNVVVVDPDIDVGDE
jgi:hypothetical protein